MVEATRAMSSIVWRLGAGTDYRSLRQRRQSFPVEADAVAGPHRRQGHALLEDERMFDIAVEPETVRLEIGAIWAGREQVNRDVVCAVAGDRQIERFCEPRDLHESCDA